MEQVEYVESGFWILITNGATRLLGSVMLVDQADFPDSSEGDGDRCALLRGRVLEASTVTLYPAFDFFAPLQPVPMTGPDGKPLLMGPNTPRMGYQRTPVVTTRDFSTEPYPVHVVVGSGTVVDFIHEMSFEDQEMYMSFIESARANYEAAREGRRQAAKKPSKIALVRDLDVLKAAVADAKKT